VIRIPRLADFALDLTAIEHALASAQPAKLLFVASPNNPDGRVVTDAELQRLLALPMLIVLDEAYVEFHGESRVAWVEQFPNLIVLRTFSKWAGLAGLRVGYGVFPREIMPHLWKIKQPYNINVAAKTAVLASLHDLEYLQQNIARIVAERERLYQALFTVEFLHPYPSRSNFILCRVVGRNARQLKLALERKGILLRYYDTPELRDCIRISVGLPEHTDRLIAELKTL
jgi:histidinol-phosphate aminotransferase